MKKGEWCLAAPLHAFLELCVGVCKITRVEECVCLYQPVSCIAECFLAVVRNMWEKVEP